MYHDLVGVCQFGEVNFCVHYADAFTFIIWFDDDGFVIPEVVQC